MKALRCAALALAVVGLSAQGAETTNAWWEVDFTSPTPVAPEGEDWPQGYGGVNLPVDEGTLGSLTNYNFQSGDPQPYLAGHWTMIDGDESYITNSFNATNTWTAFGFDECIKLDTQGNDLTWVVDADPLNNHTMSNGLKALVDADLYLVGSDSPPDKTDFDSASDVQTAVYLKNETDEDSGETTNSVLCVYVYDDKTEENYWQELDGVELKDNAWAHVQVLVDHSDPESYPIVKVYVNSTAMHARGDAGTTFWTSANGERAQTAGRVSSVAFRGTGAVDNFVGQTILQSFSKAFFKAEVFLDGKITNELCQVTPEKLDIGGTKPAEFTQFLYEEYDDDLGQPVYGLDRVEIVDFANDRTVTHTFDYDPDTGEISPMPEEGEVAFYGEGFFKVSADTTGAPGSTDPAVNITNVIARIYFKTAYANNAQAVTDLAGAVTTNDTVLLPATAGGTYPTNLVWTFDAVKGDNILTNLVVSNGAEYVDYANGKATVKVDLDAALDADTVFVTASYVAGALAEGQDLRPTTNGNEIVFAPYVPPVAIIVAGNETHEYPSLRAAVEAATAGDTITLVHDDHVSFSATDVELFINKALTIDGGSNTLYGLTSYAPPADGTADHDVYIAGSGNVTIKNLKLANFSDSATVQYRTYPIWVGRTYSGSLTLDGVTITDFSRTAVNIGGGTVLITNCVFTGDMARKDANGHAFQGGVEVNNKPEESYFATVTIADTTITGMGSDGYPDDSDSGMAAAVQMTGKGTITIESGTFAGQYSLIVAAHASGGIVVNGGEFEGGVCVEDGDGTLAIHGGLFVGDIEVASDLDCFIDGGWFDSEPAAAYVADGLAAVDYGEEAPDARATWTVEVPTVRIDFYVDDELYAWTNVAAGTTGYAPADPEKDDTAEFYYVFTGWTNAVGEAYNASQLPAATTPTNYYATFAANVRSYEVEWIVDGTYKTNTWNYNAMPSWNENDATNVPTKASTDATNFVFKAWDPEVVAVTGAGASDTATWTESVREYTITFTTNNVVYETVQAAWHATNYAPANPTAPEGKVFVGWAGAVPDEPYGADELPEVTGDATWNAVFEDAPSGHIGAKSDEGFVILAPADPDYDDTKPLTFAAPDVTAGTVGISASMIPPDSGTTATLTLLYKTDLSAATFSEAQVEVSNIDATAGTATVTLPANLGDTAFFFGFKNEDGVLDE